MTFLVRWTVPMPVGKDDLQWHFRMESVRSQGHALAVIKRDRQYRPEHRLQIVARLD